MAYLRPIYTHYCHACGAEGTEELVPNLRPHISHILNEYYCEDHAQYALEQLNAREKARFKGE